MGSTEHTLVMVSWTFVGYSNRSLHSLRHQSWWWFLCICRRTSCKGVDSSRAFNANFHNPHQMVKLLLFTVGITRSCFLGQKPLISTFNEWESVFCFLGEASVKEHPKRVDCELLVRIFGIKNCCLICTGKQLNSMNLGGIHQITLWISSNFTTLQFSIWYSFLFFIEIPTMQILCWRHHADNKCVGSMYLELDQNSHQVYNLCRI
jgi:hypothetical protein